MAKMKFNILNHFTNDVQFTADIDADDGTPVSVKVGLAVKWAIENGADLRGAYLRNADLQGADLRNADLRNADLRDAYLQGAYLRGAYLRNADLRNADLRGAYLRNADLRGADLRGGLCVSTVITLTHLRYFVLAYVTKKNGRVKMFMEIGCQRMTVQAFERALKSGKFDHEQQFIDRAMPYLQAVKQDLQRMKTEIEPGYEAATK